MMLRSFLFSLFLAAAADGFTVTTTTRTASTALHLTPSQASDLVQASRQVYDQFQEGSDDDEQDYIPISLLQKNQEPKEADAAVSPRSLVQRIFSLPSSLRHAKEEAVNFFADELGLEENDMDDDVVYFPVVGFTYVKDSPQHCRPLPRVSNPSCRLHDAADTEPVYGWFHPSV
eukprot:CAMPEP_0172445856 /NCGR_PEP_ID=MMETSP1065-20121228/5645_1 /TAXON_ID=265537 /ORGANISM="Amphiprora paludosa, Strain CCMP125" /LENGTH=173 /DNA_ID=CAMNT_0013196869 /DNA_START=244 /DNA_END=765 /DNA_ORIENTATION=-